MAATSDALFGEAAGPTTRLYAFDSAAGGTKSGDVSFTRTPLTWPAPANANVSTLTSSSATLSWTQETGFAYEVRQDCQYCPWLSAGSVDSYTFSNLTEHTTYTFQVRGKKDGVTSAVASVTETTLWNPPSGVVTSDVTTSSVKLSWTTRSGYTYEVNSGGGWASVGGASSHTFTGLSAGTTYTLSVRAKYMVSQVLGEAASVVETTLWAPPSNVQVGTLTATLAIVTWTPLTGFTYQVRPDGGTWTPVTAGSHTFLGLSPNTSYTYHLRSQKDGQNSEEVPITFTTPTWSAPGNVQVSDVTATRATLTWIHENGFTHEVRLHESSTWTPASGTGEHIFDGLTQDSPYTLFVRRSKDGATSTDGSASTRTLWAPPAGLSTSEVSSNSVKLSWTPIAGYSYEVQLDNGSWGPASSTSSHPFTGLSEHTSYTLSVRKAGGNAEAASVNETTLWAAPTGLGTSDLTASSVKLNWTPITGYSYEVRLDCPQCPWVGSETPSSHTFTLADENTSYTFYVRKAGGNAESASASVTTPWAAPTGLSTSEVSSSSVKLSWTPIAGYTYEVDWGSGWLGAGGSGSFTFTGLSAGTSYTLSVRKAGGNAEAASVVETTLWAPPSNVQVGTLTATLAIVTWTPLTGFTYQVRPDGGTWTPVTAGSHTFLGLSPNTSYTYHLRSQKDGQNSEEVPITFTTPTWSAPGNVQVSDVTATRATLTWIHENGFTHEVRLHESSTWTPASGTGEHIFDGLTQDSPYTLFVRRSKDGATSTDGSASTRTLWAPPTGVSTSEVSSNSVKLSWTPIAGYSYEVQLDNGSWGPASSTSSHPFTGLSEHTSYTLSVRKAGGNAEAASVNETTLWAAPTGVTTSELTPSSAKLNWTPLTGYSYEVRLDCPQCPWVGSETPSSHTFTLADENTSYTFYVRKAGGNAESASASVTTPWAAPTGLSTSEVSSSSVKLSWTPIAGYSYEVQLDNGSWGPASSTSSHPFTGLSEHTSYTLSVRKAGGNAEAASVVETTLWAAPTGLGTSDLTANSVKLNWTPRVGYVYEVRLGNGLWGSAETLNSHTFLGLAPSTTYSLDVRAKFPSSPVEGEPASASVTTLAGPLSAPANLTATQIRSTSTVFAWDAVTGVTTYRLHVDNRSFTTANTHQTVSQLTANTGYTAQVEALHNGAAEVSTPYSFTTAVGAPAPITTKNITATTATPDWSIITGALQYTLQWSVNSDFSNALSVSPTAAERILTDLIPSTTYYWRARGVFDTNTPPITVTDWSISSSFTTAPGFVDEPPVAAYDLFDSANTQRPAYVGGETVTLDASASQDQDEGGASIESYAWTMDNQPLSLSPTDAMPTWVLPDPATVTTYTVVLTVTDDEQSTATTSRPVTVYPANGLTVPTLTIPNDLVHNRERNPSLTWQTVEWASSYTLEVASEATFSAPIMYSAPGLTPASGEATVSHTLPQNTLDVHTHYYWRVRAVAGTYSAASPSRSFTTQAPAPMNLVPLAAVTNVGIKGPFCWDNPTYALEQQITHFEVDIRPVGGTIEHNDVVARESEVQTCYTVPEAMRPGANYEWRVRALGDLNGDTSFDPTLEPRAEYAPWQSFTTIELAVLTPIQTTKWTVLQPHTFTWVQSFNVPVHAALYHPTDNTKQLHVIAEQAPVVQDAVHATQFNGTFQWPVPISLKTGMYRLGLYDPTMPNEPVAFSEVFTIEGPATPTFALFTDLGDPAGVAFGNVARGYTAYQAIDLGNIGDYLGTEALDVTLSIGGANPEAFDIYYRAAPVSATGSHSLKSAENLSLVVVFNPQDLGYCHAELIITHTDLNAVGTPRESPLVIPLSGTGTFETADQKLTLLPVLAGHDFGMVPLGMEREQPFTIKNDGKTDLTVSASLADDGSTNTWQLLLDNVAVTNPNLTLAPGDTYTVRVKAGASQTGPSTATLTLTHNDPDYPAGTTLTIPFAMDVVENEEGPRLALLPLSWQFDMGAIFLGNTAPDQTLELRNLGTADLTVTLTPPPVGAPFTVLQGGVPLVTATTWTIAPNGTRNLVVRFAPGESHIGPMLSFLTLMHDDALQGTLQIPVWGRGVSPKPSRYYYARDHLGSVRATMTSGGDIVHYDDYYPFGSTMPRRSMDAEAPKERYTGYELDEETDLYYAGARYYDPIIGRFGATDRFTEKYPMLTPYQYAANNPLYYIDVNGDSLDVNGLDEDTRQKLLKELSEFTGLALAIDDKGFLIAVEELRGAYGTQSETARNFLLSAIESLTKVSANVQKEFRYTDQGSRGLPREIIYNTAQIEFNISSTPGTEVDQRTLGYGLSFLHELTHTDLGRDFYNTGSTIYDSPRGGVAPARQYVNVIRRELGSFFGERTGAVVPAGFRLQGRARVFNVNGNNVLIPLKKRKNRRI